MQFLAIAAVLQVAFDMPIWMGVVLSSVAILLYIITAGQYSAIITQWLQGILQTLGAFLFLFAIFKMVGNPSTCMELVFKHAPSKYLSMFEANFSMISVWVLTMGVFVFFDPWQYMNTYMGKTPRTSANAQIVGKVAGLIFAIVPVLAGIILFAADKEGLVSVPEVGRGVGQISSDGIYAWFTFDHTGVSLGSFIIMGLLMTIISCGSSFAMNGVTIISRDIYQKVIKKDKHTEQEAIFASRISCIIVCVIGIAGALWLPILVPLWSLAQALVISALLSSVFSAWFWRRSTTAGALASTIGGGCSAFSWAMYAWFSTNNPGALMHGLHAAHVGLMVSLPLMVITSLCTKADDKDKSDITNYKVLTDEVYDLPEFKGERGKGLLVFFGAKTPLAKVMWSMCILAPVLVLLFYLFFPVKVFAVSLFWILLAFGLGMFALFSVAGFFDLKNMIIPGKTST
jgi:SSS family solute:Na+ symporter